MPLKALRMLLNDRPEGGMSVERLKQLIDEELSKPTEEIDTAYVDELAQMILEYSREEQTAPKRRSCGKCRIHRWVRRSIILIALLALTSAAGAWQWIHIVEFFTPFMEQFILQVNVNENSSPVEIYKQPVVTPMPTLLAESDRVKEQILFKESSLPEHLDGQVVFRPQLPEGYMFDHARIYEDSTSIMLTQLFQNNQKQISICMVISKYSSVTSSWIVENNPYSSYRSDAYIYEDHKKQVLYLRLDRGYCIICGDISLDELQIIADQLKGVIK